jgi:hypothetical protein
MNPSDVMSAGQARKSRRDIGATGMAHLVGDNDWGVVTLAGVMARGADLETVEDRGFLIRGFQLQNGAVMPEARIAYELTGSWRLTAGMTC